MAGTSGCVNGLLGFSATPGYDEATGLGSLKVGDFVAAWANSPPALPTKISVVATLDGAPVFGPFVADFSIDSIRTAHLSGTTLPSTFYDTPSAPIPSGTYVLTFTSGGPSSHYTILPSAQQDLGVNDANCTNTCSLTFTIAFTSNGSLSTSASNLAFGNIAENTSATQPLTIKNNGSTTFSVNSLQITGSSAFTLVTPFSGPVAVTAGSTLPLTIKFAPTAATTYSGTLAIGNDSTNAGPSTTVSLSGTGMAATPSAPVLISPGTASGPGQTISTTTPTLSWSSSSNASSYIVYISQPPYGPSSLVYTSPSIPSNQTTFAVPSGPLLAGVAYSWWIAAGKVTTAPLYFQITSGSTIPAISSVSPTSYTVSANSQTVTIGGTGMSAAASVTFNIPGGGIQIIISSQFLTQSSNSISVPASLNIAGTWSVVAANSNNQLSNAYPFQVNPVATKPGTFQLSGGTPTCTPPSTVPVVSISWTAAAQATSYDVVRNSYDAGSVSSSVLSWTDPANLGSGYSYTYYVIASNAQGTTQSNTVTVSIPANVCYTQPAGNIVLGINGTGYTPAFTQGQPAASIGLPISTDSGKAMLGSASATTQSGGNWLTLNGQTSQTWTTPTTLAVTFNPTGLAPGIYNGSISFSSPQASNSPLSLSVVMRVSAPLVITTPPLLPNAYAGQPYNVTLQASGGTGFSWTLQSGSLPTGLSLNSSTGVISGTPGALNGTQAQTINISVQDSIGRFVYQTFVLNWSLGVVIAPPRQATPDWVVGAPVLNGYGYDFTVSGGTPPYQWSATGLPPGISLAGSSGILSGAPTSAGSYTIVFTVTDAAGLTGSLVYKLTVPQSPLGISDGLGHNPPSIASGVVGTAYPSALFTGGGGSGQGMQWTVTGSLPPGITTSLDSSCTPPICRYFIFSGTPTTAGIYPFTLTVTDSAGDSASNYLVFVINMPGAAPTISSTVLPLATIGQPYSFPFVASGGSGALTWSIDGPLSDSSIVLPATGTLTATPTLTNDCRTGPHIYLPPNYPASRVFFVQVTDAAGQSDVEQFCIPVYYPQPQILALNPSQVVPNGTVETITVEGQNFQPSSQIQFSFGFTQPTTYLSPTTLQLSLQPSQLSALALPNGGGLPSGTGNPLRVLSPYTLASAFATFDILLPPPTITSIQSFYSNTGQNTGQPCIPNFSCVLSLTGSGFFDESYYSIVGSSQTSQTVYELLTTSSFAPWTQVTTSAFFAPAPGTYMVQVSNPHQDGGGPATATFNVVASGAIAPTPQSFNPMFTQGDPAMNSSLTIALALSSQPAGGATVTTQSGGNWLKINGQLSTTWANPSTVTVTFDPTGLGPGTYNGSISLTQQNATNAPCVVPVAMLISPPVKISTPAALPDSFAGQPYSVTLQATGGIGFSWSIQSGTLPAGLSLNSSTGVISGTPASVTGTLIKTPTITVQDLLGRTATQTFSLNWRQGIVITLPSTGLPNLVVGSPIPNSAAYTFTVSGGTAPYQWSASGLPPGVSLSSTGTLTGTPTSANSYPVVLSVTDSTNLTGSLALTLSVIQLPLKIVDNTFGNSPPVPPAGTAGIGYESFSLVGSGGSQTGYKWTVGGSLPPGISAGPPAGCTPPGCALGISGTPTTVGTFTASVQLTDSIGTTTNNNLVFVISSPFPPYLVGDVYPSTGTAAGTFGDGVINTLDLIATLRAVVNLAGFVPPTCSDLFDAMDAYPPDTPNGRGGDGLLNTLDLITTLRRATNIDTSRPTRITLGLTCPTVTAQDRKSSRGSDPATAEALLEFGTAARSGEKWRTAVYLRAKTTLSLHGLAFSVGDSSNTQLSFVLGDVQAPDLTDAGLPGTITAAWLNRLEATAGKNILLGYIETALPPSLNFLGVSANESQSERSVNVALSQPSGNRPR